MYNEIIEVSEMLKRISGENVLLKNVKLGSSVDIRDNSVLENVTVGDFCSIAENTSIFNANVGRFCLISSFVNINYCNEKTVEIGHNVQIGHNVLIMPGVRIGNGAVIGPGSIVTKDVENYSIVIGEPAAKVKMRFTEQTISKIEDSKWWDMDFNKIKTMITAFRNVNDFVTQYN